MAVTTEGRQLFVKVLGDDGRDADLLYRAYRFVRLPNVDDVRPAASFRQAGEHEALLGLMAGRAGVRAPHVERVIEADDGSTVLVMEAIAGTTVDDVDRGTIGDELLRGLWVDVDRLDRAGVAHRSFHAGNVRIDADGRPWIVEFSFSELTVSDRRRAIDIAELLACPWPRWSAPSAPWRARWAWFLVTHRPRLRR